MLSLHLMMGVRSIGISVSTSRLRATTSILTDSSDSGLTKSPWDDFDHLFTSQMMSDLGSTVMLTTTFVNAAVKLIQKRGPNPWPISHIEWRLFVDLVDPLDISFDSNPPSSRNSVIIDLQIYMASRDARKQVIESLRGGMMVVPWIEKEHFTLVVGYATTEDHMHCFHIDSLATPRSDSPATPCASILKRFIEATRKETPTISITPVAINTLANLSHQMAPLSRSGGPS